MHQNAVIRPLTAVGWALRDLERLSVYNRRLGRMDECIRIDRQAVALSGPDCRKELIRLALDLRRSFCWPIHPIHCLFAASSLLLFIVYSRLCTVYSLSIHCLFTLSTAYSLSIHCLFTVYSPPFHCLFTYSLPIHCLFNNSVAFSVHIDEQMMSR
jgi:hypothetical protein